MTDLKELLKEVDDAKAQGRLWTTGGIGAALVGGFALPIIAPIGILAGTYGLYKKRKAIHKKPIMRAWTKIQETLNFLSDNYPELRDNIIQILLSLTDSNKNPLVRDFNNLSIITNIEKNKLSVILKLLIESGIVIEISEDKNQKHNKLYTIHELIANFIITKSESKIQQSEIQEN